MKIKNIKLIVACFIMSLVVAFDTSTQRSAERHMSAERRAIAMVAFRLLLGEMTSSLPGSHPVRGSILKQKKMKLLSCTSHSLT